MNNKVSYKERFCFGFCFDFCFVLFFFHLVITTTLNLWYTVALHNFAIFFVMQCILQILVSIYDTILQHSLIIKIYTLNWIKLLWTDMHVGKLLSIHVLSTKKSISEASELFLQSILPETVQKGKTYPLLRHIHTNTNIILILIHFYYSAHSVLLL